MSDPKSKRPIFWPMLFMTAFVAGAILWSLWMARAIRQTRENRVTGFFVPMVTNPTYGGSVHSISNQPTNTPTNSALKN